MLRERTSFIHIEHLYSASSSKLLRSAPNTSTVKQSSLKVRKNAGEVVLLKMRSSEGRPFQVEGPTTEKARICIAEVRAKGTRRRPCWDERSDRELIALRVGQQNQETHNDMRLCLFFYFLSFNVISLFHMAVLLSFSCVMFAAVYQVWFNKNEMTMKRIHDCGKTAQPAPVSA